MDAIATTQRSKITLTQSFLTINNVFYNIEYNMNTKTVITKATKYFLAVLVTMYLWQIAGSFATAKSTLLNIIGACIYFGMAIKWYLLVKEDIKKSIDYINKNVGN